MRISKRAFLRAAMAGVAASADRAMGAPQSVKTLPTVPFGRHRISRLIAGANPINGYGHSTRRMDELMLSYFTVERTVDYILRCEQEGITTWQTSYSPKVEQALRLARERGSSIQLILLASGSDRVAFERLVAMRPLGICHHGGVTDRLMRAGEPGQIHDYVKRVKDAGFLAGVSTHSPDHLARIEDSAWENDFYMTCCYYVTRPAEEIRARLRDDFLGEPFLAGDPDRMMARIRQVRKTCLAFKILAAGRLCGDKASVERAFGFAYQNIKPTDAVIVGMFPVVSDEIREDSDLARKFASA